MIQQDMKNKEYRIHPTQKPVRLFEMILRDYYKNKECRGIVADFFSGSGTTAIACHNLGIPFICTEKKFQYYQHIQFHQHLQFCFYLNQFRF